MIFRRKKPSTTPGDGQPALRGRDSAENSSNPLARRFHPEDEPDTIDLQQPAPTVPEYLSVVTVDPGTGKFYVQPGQGDSTVYLGDEAVRAPTELRRGDCVRVGDFELQIPPGQKNRE